MSPDSVNIRQAEESQQKLRQKILNSLNETCFSLEGCDYSGTHLPPEIGQLQNLQTLNLSLYSLTHLPPEIGQLQNLQTLELYHNRELAHLPVEIGQIKQLTRLGLSTTACKDLSPLANHPNPKLRIGWGYELYLDRRYWTHPSQLKVKWLLSEKNIKVREQLIERIGFDRVCQELEAEIRHLLIQRIGFDGILKEMQAGAISTQELSSVPQAKFSEDGFDSWIEEARQKTLNSFNAMSSKNLGWVSLSWDIQVRPSEISDAVGQATLVYPDTGKILRLEWKNNENEGHEGEKVTFFYDDRPLILNHVRDTYHLSYSGDETTTHKEELDVPNLPCYQLVQGILCNQPWVYNFIEDDKTNTKSLRLSKGESSHFRSTSVSQTTISYRFDLTTLQCTYTYYSYTDICP